MFSEGRRKQTVLRFGIWNLKGLQRTQGRSQPRRHISLSLYNSLNSLPDDIRIEFEEKILFHFGTPTRITKRTYKDRFPEFDDLSANCIREMARNKDKILIHDVAVSDGHTAVELYYKLKKEITTSILYLASDAYTTFNSITRTDGYLSV